MRLYRQHDLDLIYLYKLKEFDFHQAIKDSIRAAKNNTRISIPVPKKEQKISPLQLPKYIQCIVYFSGDDDAPLIEWVSGITKGYRNNALKNLLRNNLSGFVYNPYDKSIDLRLLKNGAARFSLPEPSPDEKIEDDFHDFFAN